MDENIGAQWQKMEEELRQLRQQLSESQWYLGEEKTKREQTENALRDTVNRCQDLEAQLSQVRAENYSLQHDLQETRWYLGEERAKLQCR
jgi:septal ring factor EnvC (AmiA/AmiB activator)